MQINDTDRGEGLRSRRLAAGLTISQLAGLADCSSSTIERLEGGERPKTSPTLVRLYTAIDAHTGVKEG